MRRILAALLLLAPSIARAEEPARAEPPSGLLLLLAGSGLTAGGVVDLATAPLCRLGAIRSSAQPACIGTSVGVGVALLGAGVPLLVLGARQREAWRAWKLQPTTGGASVTWEARW
jgi:hypothetical protein